ncbi:hypothetical protein P7K49_012917 [Saguinus oedipus]|uniref:Uncharacterized protein n=1 Tax=Saguinus oedipus TaxID=9490 RepID=A0ABQ9VHD8_SAGOE|nr:hypothetical protein P7K49_012917 [Saguinus oedipus]
MIRDSTVQDTCQDHPHQGLQGPPATGGLIQTLEGAPENTGQAVEAVGGGADLPSLPAPQGLCKSHLDTWRRLLCHTSHVEGLRQQTQPCPREANKESTQGHKQWPLQAQCPKGVDFIALAILVRAWHFGA